MHDKGRGVSVGEQFSHSVHIWCYVFEKHFIALAKCVQPCLTVLGFVETVFRAFSVTGKIPLAAQAFSRQAIAFCQSETCLRLRSHHGLEIVIFNIAEQIFRIDEMVAGVQVSVVLYNGIAPAGLCIDACAWHFSAPIGQGGIKEIDEVLSDIVPDPIIEDVTHEMPEVNAVC